MSNQLVACAVQGQFGVLHLYVRCLPRQGQLAAGGNGLRDADALITGGVARVDVILLKSGRSDWAMCQLGSRLRGPLVRRPSPYEPQGFAVTPCPATPPTIREQRLRQVAPPQVTLVNVERAARSRQAGPAAGRRGREAGRRIGGASLPGRSLGICNGRCEATVDSAGGWGTASNAGVD